MKMLNGFVAIIAAKNETSSGLSLTSGQPDSVATVEFSEDESLIGAKIIYDGGVVTTHGTSKIIRKTQIIAVL